MSKRKQNSSTPVFLAIGGGLLLIVAAILLATQNAPAAPTADTAFEENTYPFMETSPNQKPPGILF